MRISNLFHLVSKSDSIDDSHKNVLFKAIHTVLTNRKTLKLRNDVHDLFKNSQKVIEFLNNNNELSDNNDIVDKYLHVLFTIPEVEEYIVLNKENDVDEFDILKDGFDEDEDDDDEDDDSDEELESDSESDDDEDEDEGEEDDIQDINVNVNINIPGLVWVLAAVSTFTVFVSITNVVLILRV